ncbi:MAG TPA: SpoIIE family protein phosphatase [Spirochaetota bacterium]|nr:SpoIIE family protein phosphatase [Spirochaetota bacterium]HNT10053.1 SpoIIE family protein phosphatase [Spirochaetota bacterium]
MNPALLDNVLLTHNAFITATAAMFTVLVGAFILSIKRKSSASAHLGLALIAISFTNIAFTVAFAWYHPLAAYHRWLTMLPVLLGIGHLAIFFFYFPTDRNRTAALIFIAAVWIVAIVDEVVWVRQTLHFTKYFQPDGQIWDVEESRLAAINAALIMSYIVAAIVTGAWRVVASRKRERAPAAVMLACFTIVTILPGIANAMARQGALERDVFILAYALISVLGWFSSVIVYLNLTRDQTTFMAKIMGVTLATVLVILMGISFFTSRDADRLYDELRVREAERIAADPSYRPPGVASVIAYSNATGETRPLQGAGPVAFDRAARAEEFASVIALERIAALPAGFDPRALETILENAPSHFTGYGAVIRTALHSDGPSPRPGGTAAVKRLAGLARARSNLFYKVQVLPDERFRQELARLLSEDHRGLAPFTRAIDAHLRARDSEGTALKREVLRYLAPIPRAGSRIIRTDAATGEHRLSFIIHPAGSERLYEVGFSYRGYREYVHASAVRFFIILGLVLVAVLAGFRLFFLGALTRPLERLLNGVAQVEQGNLDVRLSVAAMDEIGFLTKNFNRMVRTIRMTRKKLYRYTTTLEEMVHDRTAELQSARDALWGEMQLAMKIQTVLLPTAPSIPGYEIDVTMSPASEVGGDYYDVINAAGRHWVIIGDVSGHGVPAGLIMMMIQMAIHTAVSRDPAISPAELLADINAIVTGKMKLISEDKYMTITAMSCGEGGRFTFAGLHQDILIFRAATGTVEAVETQGMWLGIAKNLRGHMRDDTLALGVGDVMLLYTDGITEARRGEHGAELFGSLRLRETFARAGHGSSAEIRRAILDAVEGYHRFDDVTLMVIRRTG